MRSKTVISGRIVGICALFVAAAPVVGACSHAKLVDSAVSRPEVNCGDIQPVHVVPPDYPPELEAHRPYGSVVVRHDILANGSVANARIVETPDPALNGHVLTAIRKWRYRPGPCLPMKGVITRIH